MQTLRYYYHLVSDVSSAVLFTLSIGAGSSILGASVTRTLAGGVVGALIGTALGAAGFGFALWRTYKPQDDGPFAA